MFIVVHWLGWGELYSHYPTHSKRTKQAMNFARPTKRAKISNNPYLPDTAFKNIMSFIVDPYYADKQKHKAVWQTIKVECPDSGCQWKATAFLPVHMAIEVPDGLWSRNGLVWGKEEIEFSRWHHSDMIASKSWRGVVYHDADEYYTNY